MKDLISYIAQALVDHPEDVKVTQVEGERTTVLELSVAKSDLGLIIGKQGRMIQSIKTVLSAASAKRRKRCILEIIK